MAFSEITSTTLNVSWGEPAAANGVLQGYRVVYEPLAPVQGEARGGQQGKPTSRARKPLPSPQEACEPSRGQDQKVRALGSNTALPRPACNRTLFDLSPFDPRHFSPVSAVSCGHHLLEPHRERRPIMFHGHPRRGGDRPASSEISLVTPFMHSFPRVFIKLLLHAKCCSRCWSL